MAAKRWRQVASAPTLPQWHQYAIIKIAIDPRDPDNIYAARRAGGVIKSDDRGTTWHRANTGLTDRNVNALAIDPHDPRILYLSTGAPSASTQAHVFQSTDGARTWHPLSDGLPAVGVTAFAIEPSGRSVFAATEGDGVIELRQPHRG
jgi:Sortilin, neurotensin receptor 3,